MFTTNRLRENNIVTQAKLCDGSSAFLYVKYESIFIPTTNELRLVKSYEIGVFNRYGATFYENVVSPNPLRAFVRFLSKHP